MTDRNEREREVPSQQESGQHAPAEPGDEVEVPQRHVRFTRKWFLVALGGAAAALVGFQRLLRDVGAGGSSDGGGGSSSGLLAGDDFPVRTVDEVPRIELQDWVIEVDGLVERPLQIDAAAWAALPRFEETVDFNCVEGWSVPAVRWGGVRPDDLIALAGPLPRATHAVFHAFDGEYTDGLSLEQVREPRTILADTLDGRRVSPDHGGPVRLIVPAQLAYKSVKFVRRVELTDHQVRGYWEERGYPVDAPVAG